MKFAGKWMELENIILCEVTQTQKDKHGGAFSSNREITDLLDGSVAPRRGARGTTTYRTARKFKAPSD
ncbi:hypothetical protein STEG23_009042 [Scotinomys teguina]